ncbi:iron complex transport system permease protein [Diaminobutyricimonas aerilata]|uniref:Iron complex transport system permease protein n=1 Tax=Diaminobutyricimonas aerilata TaxID=1162967 RepID=A0A2M9CGM0_9MICO|nr:iron chelate uptake ABC transporter family permease subunit [Diaminobutyricimonas aerilata]PJJ71037.1 iron complex transport system permease protein [Diaminobutyricimonas aerilata]
MTPTPSTTPAAPVTGRPASRRRRLLAGVAVGAGLLVVACALSLVLGSRTVSLDEVLGGLTDPDATGFGEAAVATRVPRTVLAVLVGAALGLAGAIMQGLTRNPLADPGILGVNLGSALAVVIGIAVFGIASVQEYVWFAFAGAAAASVLVYAIGSIGREGATPLKLALAGAAISAALSSFVSAVLLTRTDVFDVFRFWQVGGVGGADFGEMTHVLPFVGAGAVLAVLSIRSLDLLSLGDDLARGLGGRVGLARAGSGLAIVLLCGAATAIAGPIGFVGLVVPHAARFFTGPAHRWLLPYSALFGAVLLVAADVVGRVISRPSDIQVGIMTAVIGAPVFIWLIRRSKVREL